MLIIFRKTPDSERTLNKTFTDLTNVEVVLKSDFDISNPVLRLVESESLNFSDFNSFTIPELGRSYLIERAEKLTNKLVRISAKTDYLETFRSEILAAKMEVKRELKTGDYGKIELSTTGQKETANYLSPESVGGKVNYILTVMRFNQNG